MKIITVQLGARMYYAVPRILHQAGMLARFHTDILGDRGWPRCLSVVPRAWLPGSVRRLRARRLPDIPRSLVRTHPGVALRERWRTTRARSADELGAAFIRAGDEICREVVRGGLDSAGAVFVVGSSSRVLFEEARRRGMRTIMEAIIAPPAVEEALIQEEERRHPDWAAGSMALRARDFDALVRKEWSLADLIICGSEFVRESTGIAGGPIERCVVIPYGLSQVVAPRARHLEPGRPFRVLTVGMIGLRKGSPYVAAAADALRGKCEFRMVGAPPENARARENLGRRVTLTGPVPRDQIGAHYEWADAFLLPSLCEGSATVIFEALGHGLPIVTTANSGSVVASGREGFVVPIRDVPAIVRSLESIASDGRRYEEMSLAALRTAAEYSFDRYARLLVEALGKLEEPSPVSRT
jgi:hypothetical protein